MPQGSVLGPILFLVYINGLEEGVTGKLLKFADDTILFKTIKEMWDKQKLHDDINKLVRWSEKWQMLFNFGKCNCLHTGPGNTGMTWHPVTTTINHWWKGNIYYIVTVLGDLAPGDYNHKPLVEGKHILHCHFAARLGTR